MEIEKRLTTKTVGFGTLNTGDVFLYDDDVYIVVDKDFGLGAERQYDGYAISPKNGWHYGFDDEDEVIKVTAKLTITD